MLVSLFKKYIPKGSFRSRYFSGTFWMLLGTGIAQVSTFIVAIIAARLLGSVSFGKFGMIQSTLVMFTLFAGLGMGLTNKRFVGELRDQDPIRCGRVIGFSMVISWIASAILALILFIGAPTLARDALNAPDLEILLKDCCGPLVIIGVE